MNKMLDNNTGGIMDYKNITAYKIIVSILFGLLGFVVNFYSIDFPFPPYTATVLIGLLFPMLITLTWGWRYGRSGWLNLKEKLLNLKMMSSLIKKTGDETI